MTNGSRGSGNHNDNAAFEAKFYATKLVAEVMRARRVWPIGTKEPLQHLSIIGEEFGECQRVMNDAWNSQKPWKELLAKELIQTGAMCIRALMELKL